MPADYQEARRSVVSAAYDGQITRFIATYNPNWPTVVILPGGMGSQLERSPAPFNPPHELPLGQFEPVWMDFGILFAGEGHHLEIDSGGRDAAGHVVIANGPLEFILVGYPYEQTKLRLAKAGYNVAVFGYDWRRPVTESAGWLEQYLDKLMLRAGAKREPGAGRRIDDVYLLAHSMGGLVAAAYLQNRFPPGTGSAEVESSGIRAVVTAGTPFYATASNIFRYFKGQDPLNILYGTGTLSRIAASMPGPYVLNYPSEQLWRDHGGLGLERYPLRDASDPENKRADMHHPEIKATRLPPWVSRSHIARASAAKTLCTDFLPAPVMERLWHVRTGLDRKTPVELHWHPPAKPADLYDPDNDPLPFDVVRGPGDNTVPYWGAALAHTPASHVYDCARAKDHQSLLEHEEVLRVFLDIAKKGRLPTSVTISAPVELPARASDARVDELCEDIRAGAADMSDPRVNDRRVWRNLMERCPLC